MIEKWYKREPMSADKLNRVTDQLRRADRIQVVGSGTVTQNDDGTVIRLYDKGALTASDIAVDWLHLGNNGEETETLGADLKYWLEIDLMANSLINAVTLGSGVAFPTGNDLLVWKLCETNADGKIDKQYRAGTVKDGTLRFTQVVAPDVPIGTIYIWSNALTIPLGWGEVDMKGRVPVGLDAGDTDYDTLGATGGNAFVDLSHHHGESLEVPDAYGDPVEVCGTYAPASADVEDWIGEEPTPDENNILDNRMPYRVVRFIVRTAI